MNIKDTFLSDAEVSEFYRNALNGLIAKSDLAPTQRVQILNYANRQREKALELIGNLVHNNPGTSFEYWTERSLNYNKAERVINWLSEQVLHTKTNDQTIAIRDSLNKTPTIEANTAFTLFQIIKGFFNTDQQTDLKVLLETGTEVNTKLLFKDNGNRLTDAFKKLIEHDLITGCTKKDLSGWIVSNFSFMYRSKEKAFISETVLATISTDKQPCKSPLIEITNGKIVKVERPRKKKKASKY